ncbi:hypothetical protein CLV51_103355 [Chitinophaga niastensis]|uniref:Uncharacterized protein n=1 Tax=Chitinophaga niastensis TaxID=536980 RepID=A0A2P8HJH9_CHINA|nr:hypothetical protein [Chitinophaga niastensis]PSL46377.1 hypothetical protein CLV51_103355 [Chitinophaga niastensis]
MIYRNTMLASLVLLAMGCSKKNNTDTNNADGKDKPLNKMMVNVSGDFNKSYTVTGEDVGIGYLKFTKTGLETFVLSGGITDAAGTLTSVSTGVLSLQLQTGVEQVGEIALAGGASIRSKNADEVYSGISYFQYFDTDPDGKNSKAYLTLTEIKDTANYLRLTGSFHVNAAKVSPEPSMACQQDAYLHSGRSPMFSSVICGAKDVQTKASFVIYLDKITQQ